MSEANGNWPPCYIMDGYTQRAYIRGLFNVHGPCRFDFRPALLQDRAVIYGEIARTQDARKQEAIQAATIARYVSNWNLKKGDGSPIAIDTKDILRLRQKLVTRIFTIVCGEEGGDIDPEADDFMTAAQIDDELTMVLAGSRPEEREAEAEKNS